MSDLIEREDGASPSDRATAAEPVVSALRDGIPDAEDCRWDDPDEDCWNCGGEGFVFGCSWDWQCDTWDDSEMSCLCMTRCQFCNPPAQGMSAGTDETAQQARGDSPPARSRSDAPKGDHDGQ